MSPPNYTAEFEAWWRECDKAGSKLPAFEAWQQVGSPPGDILLASRREWLAHWGGIGVTHISTWLRNFDWQQKPERTPANGHSGPQYKRLG